jgi:glutathione synthase
MSNIQKITFIKPSIIEDATEWAIMHGVAFKQSDNTARHCPFSIAPMAMNRNDFEHLLKVTPLIAKLISQVSQDHDFLQSTLGDMAKSDPFFGRLMALHREIHGTSSNRYSPARLPLLLLRTDYMDDRTHGAKVVEFNGIAAGMAPFGQRATELHHYIKSQWPETYNDWSVDSALTSVDNFGLTQLAYGISASAHQIKENFKDDGKPIFLMVVQKDEDNVYDQHLLEVELQKLGLKTIRRTFEQLATQLSSGEGSRLLLKDVGAVDTVYLRAGYQYSDYWAPDLNESTCCQTLSETRLFIERHHVAVNATISQQLATSKTMQMVLTMMRAEDYSRWGITTEEAKLIKSVLADMKPISVENIDHFIENFNADVNKQKWVLKNQGEGGGHCIFDGDISEKLNQLPPEEFNAWALMQRLYPHEREKPTVAIRDGEQTLVKDLVSEIGIFTVNFNGVPVTEYNGYAGYLIRSKPGSENEGGIHSGQGILDSLTLID